MKKTFISITILVASMLSAYSQGVHSYYFLDEWSRRHILNPSFAPEYGYFSLPVFGGFELGLSSNTGLTNYIYPLDPLNPLYSKYKFTTFLDKSVDGTKFINSLPSNVTFNQNMKINLFSFGFYTIDKSFWSVDITMKENFEMNLPVDFFRFAKFGMTSPTNNVYNLKNFGLEQTNIAQVSLGYSREINSKLRVGLNAKLLLGLSKVKMNYSKFDLTLSNNGYTMNASGESYIMTNMMNVGVDSDHYYDFSNITTNTSSSKPAGTGAAFDIGFTYKPIKQLTIAASLNDIGIMNWNATSIKKGIATSNVNFSGFSNINTDSINESIQGQLNQLKTDATNLMKFKETANNKDFSDNVPFTMNASAEYSLFANDNHDIRLGLLYQSYNSTLIKKNEFIGAITLKPLSWLAFSGTADIFSKDYNRYGFALNFSPRWINLFLASDFITPKINKQFLPIDKVDLNISFGGSIVIGKPRDSDRDGVVDRRDKCPGTPFGVRVDKNGCPIDSDGDGVPDYIDQCPDTPVEAYGKVDIHGCPQDSDGDGVPDYLDECPDTPTAARGFVNAKGCPIDTDNDGIPDYLDKCANTPAGVEVDSVGCPIDRDGDGVPDYLDKCPGTPAQAKGMVDKDGCPLDTDGDGVPDYLDLCPATPVEARGYIDKNGCLLDTDGDGVPDYLDKCADTPLEARGMIDEHGCPRDIDGDGIPDYLDKCPTIPGIAANKGCPEVKKEIKTLFLKALRGIVFESGNSVIKKTSYVILNQIAKVIIENPSFKIEIRGHTDNIGDAAKNLALSQNRANAVKEYLISKGVNERKITTNGFGDKQPIASNSKPASRKLNRRVEFIVTFD